MTESLFIFLMKGIVDYNQSDVQDGVHQNTQVNEIVVA